MNRILASFAFAALAACGSKTSPRPVDNGGGATGSKLAVVLAAPDAEMGLEDMGVSRTLAPAPGSQFPAVSADGTTIVDLVADAQDFSGIPIATVVFWTRSGVAASFQLVSTMGEEGPPDQAKLEQTTVEQINAKLAETTWTPIAKVSASGEDPETGAPSTLDLGDGTTITLAQVADRFPAPGEASSEMGGGGCGDVIGLADGYGSRQIGFAVVFPQVNLGGDDCFGSPSAELAIVVPLT